MDNPKEILDELKKQFFSAYEKDREITKILEELNGSSRFKTADRFAKEVGRLASATLTKVVKADNLTNGEFTEEIGLQAVKPFFEAIQKLIADKTAIVQKNVNSQLGLNIQAIKPKFESSRIDNLVTKINEADEFADAKWLLEDGAVENFTTQVVRDSVKANADYGNDIGVKAYITRSTNGGCCDWCERLSGTYEYGKQPADFFKTHKDCGCTIEYHPSKHSYHRISYYVDDSSKLRKRTEKL